jgi:hypothetical protein
MNSHNDNAQSKFTMALDSCTPPQCGLLVNPHLMHNPKQGNHLEMSPWRIHKCTCHTWTPILNAHPWKVISNNSKLLICTRFIWKTEHNTVVESGDIRIRFFQLLLLNRGADNAEFIPRTSSSSWVEAFFWSSSDVKEDTFKLIRDG